ncbi:MAG: YtxH domain-containing protein [Microcoleus sp. SM1_3_4]|nr:YtxH domain-containing protein [Microcoleus sp. SM1_3_4]
MLRQITSLFIGLACGAALGTAVVMLLTPDSGENLRKRSRQWYDNLLKESAEAANVRRQELQIELRRKIAAPDNFTLYAANSLVVLFSDSAFSKMRSWRLFCI